MSTAGPDVLTSAPAAMVRVVTTTPQRQRTDYLGPFPTIAAAVAYVQTSHLAAISINYDPEHNVETYIEQLADPAEYVRWLRERSAQRDPLHELHCGHPDCGAC